MNLSLVSVPLREACKISITKRASRLFALVNCFDVLRQVMTDFERTLALIALMSHVTFMHNFDMMLQSVTSPEEFATTLDVTRIFYV